MTDRETLDVLLERLNGRLDRQDEHLIAIRAQVELTNGRVTTLELGNAVREGARQERERIAERSRTTRALELAAAGLWRPALVSGAVVGVIELLKTLT